MSFVANYPVRGVPIYTNLAAFPALALNGSLAVAQNTDILYIFNGTSWVVLADPSTSTFTPANLTDVGTDGITITGGTNAVNGSGTTISQHVADATHNGYLSSTDWSTFNNKGSGSVTSVAMTVPTFLSIGGSPITTSGTLAVTLSGTALPLANGGTGQTTKAAAFDALSPMSAGGDLIYGGASGTGTRLANGSAGQVLTSAGTTLAPTWATPTTGTVTSVGLSVPATSILSVTGSPVTGSGTLGLVTTGTSGGIPYFSSTSQLASSALLTANQLILGGGTGATPVSLAAGSQYQVLRMGASNPAYGSINLDQSAAVTGVLPNGNTTAASANTASTIVARDGSGNFTAGTITAALTGTASGNTTYSANNHGVVLSSTTNAMTVIAPDSSTTKVLMSGGSSADPAWMATNGIYTLWNLGLALSVGSSALTIALKQADGSTNPAASGPVLIGTRSSTLTSALYNIRSVTGALSVVVPSTATLGMKDAKAGYIYVYAIDNAGTIELAVSSSLFDESGLVSTTTISGSATSATVMYSTTGRSNVACRLIGRLISNQTTAGTWAAVPTTAAVGQYGALRDVGEVKFFATVTGSKTIAPNNSAIKIAFDSATTDTTGYFDATNNRYLVTIPGTYSVKAAVFINSTNVLANNYQGRIYKNGSLYTVGFNMTVPVTASFSATAAADLPNCIPGDYFEVFVSGAGNNGTNTLTTDSGSTTVQFSGFKI